MAQDQTDQMQRTSQAPLPSTRSFLRAPADVRRNELIQATLDCIADSGLQGATVRDIARRANVTNGLVRHYFDGKDHLIHSAYHSFISGMTASAVEAAGRQATSSGERMQQFIHANLSAPLMDGRSLSIWSAFVGVIGSDPILARIHREQYERFRKEIETLLVRLHEAHDRTADDNEIRRLAIKINAIIDGLWLEGCMAPQLFKKRELSDIGVETIEALLGFKLGDQP